jgi:protein ImuB
MQQLPIEAMELEAHKSLALRRAGLKTLGDLDKRARASMAARFGTDFPDRLDRILGRCDARITPHRLPPPVLADRVLSEPILELESVHALILDLADDLAQQLEERLQGARLFCLTLYRVDGCVRRISVQTARAGRDPAVVMRLYRERIAALSCPLEVGFGFDHLRMSAEDLQQLPPVQTTLDARSDNQLAMDGLLDRLCARLGPEAVLHVEPLGSHVPEFAWRALPVQAVRRESQSWPEQEESAPPLRPLLLFDPPERVEATALAPDSPPVMFRWRRVTRRITRAEGPERITAEWWRAPRHRVRDYYRVEDEEGLRFWLFRAGEYGAEPPPRWYVHGLFA